MARKKSGEEVVRKTWEDTFPPGAKVTVTLDGKKVIEKMGGKRG